MKTIRKKHSGFMGILLGIFYLLLLTLILSCRSVPVAPPIILDESDYIPLEPGAFVYLFVDLENGRNIIEYLPLNTSNNRQFQQMIDRTNFAVAAMYHEEENRHRMQLAAWGNFPASQARSAFRLSRQWRRQHSEQSGLSYWYARSSGLSIAVESQQAFIAHSFTENPADPFPPSHGTRVPESFHEFSRDSILSCWMENPGLVVNQLLHQMEIPLELPAERILISLFPLEADPQDGNAGEQLYTARIRLQFSSASLARGLVSIFTLGRSFFLFNPDLIEGSSAMLASLLFSNPPVQHDRNLDIQTDALNSSEIALLFSMFSL